MGEVVVSVADTGPGISLEERSRIFDPFYQAGNPARKHTGGTGLGLAICKTFVQLHGGRIWLESEAGKGSRFSFTIPTRATVSRIPSEWKLAGAPDPFQNSIVTVDENGRLAHVLERALPQFKVHNASGPAEVKGIVDMWHPKAVVAFNRASADGLLRQLKDAAPWPGLPLVLCRLREGRPLNSFQNVKAVLTKPVSAAALLQAIESLGRLDSLLVADDDEGMTRLVERTLSRSGSDTKVLTAHDGEQALMVLRDERPQAMILDLAMPEMDGQQVLERMAEDGLTSVPVLVLTAIDLHGEAGQMASDGLEVSSCAGLTEAEVVRYLEALAQVARPRYVGEPLSTTEPALPEMDRR